MLSSLEEASANSTSNNSVADTNSTTAHGGSRNPVHEPPSDAGDLNCDARSQVLSSL